MPAFNLTRLRDMLKRVINPQITANNNTITTGDSGGQLLLPTTNQRTKPPKSIVIIPAADQLSQRNISSPHYRDDDDSNQHQIWTHSSPHSTMTLLPPRRISVNHQTTEEKTIAATTLPEKLESLIRLHSRKHTDTTTTDHSDSVSGRPPPPSGRSTKVWTKKPAPLPHQRGLSTLPNRQQQQQQQHHQQQQQQQQQQHHQQPSVDKKKLNNSFTLASNSQEQRTTSTDKSMCPACSAPACSGQINQPRLISGLPAYEYVYVRETNEMSTRASTKTDSQSREGRRMVWSPRDIKMRKSVSPHTLIRAPPSPKTNGHTINSPNSGLLREVSPRQIIDSPPPQMVIASRRFVPWTSVNQQSQSIKSPVIQSTTTGVIPTSSIPSSGSVGRLRVSPLIGNNINVQRGVVVQKTPFFRDRIAMSRSSSPQVRPSEFIRTVESPLVNLNRSILSKEEFKYSAKQAGDQVSPIMSRYEENIRNTDTRVFSPVTTAAATHNTANTTSTTPVVTIQNEIGRHKQTEDETSLRDIILGTMAAAATPLAQTPAENLVNCYYTLADKRLGQQQQQQNIPIIVGRNPQCMPLPDDLDLESFTGYLAIPQQGIVTKLDNINNFSPRKKNGRAYMCAEC